MVATLLPYFLFAMLMLGFVAFDRLRRRGQFREPTRNWSHQSGSDGSPSAGFWGSSSTLSLIDNSGSSCSVSSDSGGGCGGDGGGGGGGD